MLVASIGIQPNQIAEEKPDAWDGVVALVTKERVVAMGETGLDRHWNYTPFAQQEDYFARHLQLARRQDRAVIIHCREAEADVVRMLREDYDRQRPGARRDALVYGRSGHSGGVCGDGAAHFVCGHGHV